MTRNLVAPGDPAPIGRGGESVGRREDFTSGGVGARVSFRLVGADQACLRDVDYERADRDR